MMIFRINDSEMIVRVTAPGIVGAYRDLATQPVAVLAVDIAVHVVVHGLPAAGLCVRDPSRFAGKAASISSNLPRL